MTNNNGGDRRPYEGTEHERAQGQAWSEAEDFASESQIDDAETTMMEPVFVDELPQYHDHDHDHDHDQYTDDPYGNRRFDPEDSRVTDPDQLNEELEQAKRDRDDALYEADEAKERNETLQEEYQKQEEEWDAQREEFEAEKEKAKKYMAIMGVAIALLAIGGIFLLFQNANLNSEREAAMEEGRALSSEEAGIKISELEKERDDLLGQRDEAVRKQEEMEGKVSSANADRDRIQGELDAERRNSGGSADVIREKDATIGNLTRENEGLRREVEEQKNRPRETTTETATTTVTTTVQPPQGDEGF